MTESLITEAAEFLEKCGDIGQWSHGGDSEGKAQIKNLQKWAQSKDRFAEYAPPAGALVDGGSEHELFFDTKAGRIRKRTNPPGTFGLLGFGQKLERIATPYFYLRRLALMNRVFDSGISLEGITPGEMPSIISSQQFYTAADLDAPHPSKEEVAIYMYGHGFAPQRNVRDGWSRDADGIIALDARPDNFIKTINGVVAIDLVLQGGPGGTKLEKVIPAPNEVRMALKQLKQMPPPAEAEVERQLRASKAFRELYSTRLA